MRGQKEITGQQGKQGSVMLMVTLFFAMLGAATIFSTSNLAVHSLRDMQNSARTRQSYATAESGIEDVYYRLKNNMNVSATESLSLGSSSATTTVTTIGTDQKQIESTGTRNSIQRKITTRLTAAPGVAFNYGLQAGNGGVLMDGGSTIIGNIYSNGNIDAVSATITGSAIAADSIALAADQTNESPLPPTSSLNFRNASGSQDFAQSFQVSSTEPLKKVQFYIKKTGSPSDATVRLVANNNGSPSTTTIPIGTVSLSSGLVTTSYGWAEVVFSSYPSLIPGTTYWIVIDSSSSNSNNYYTIASNSTYANGAAKTGSYGGSWTTTNADGYFRIYTGGTTSTIGRATYSTGLLVGTSGVGDVWATTVKGTSAQGGMYCTTGTNTNKPCDTSRGSPPAQPLPFSDANIQSWKDAAAAGGTITGNHSVGWAGGTLGPKRITGNLTISGGGTLTLTGPLWVEGNVSITGGGKLALPANYAQYSETIVSDGYMTINGGGSVGSGTSGSYLFLVSTSLCPYAANCSGNYAIRVSGGAGAIAINAQEGGVILEGGASLKAAVGNYITISGGSTVTYDSGLASPSFSSGPSGEWGIESWKEPE